MNLIDSPRHGRAFDMLRSIDSCGSTVVHHAKVGPARARHRNQGLRGTVSIAAPQGIGVHWLAKRLPLFNRWYPNIKVTLKVEIPAADVTRNTVDATLSVGETTGQALAGHIVGRTHFGFYASELYLADHGQPITTEQLVCHSVINLHGTFEHLPDVIKLRDVSRSAAEAVRCDSVCAQLMAARAGVGIAPLPSYVIEDSPELMRVLPNAFGVDVDMWLYTRTNATVRPPIQAFLDWLKVELADNGMPRAANNNALGDTYAVMN